MRGLMIFSWTSNMFQEVLTALESFGCYHHIWQKDKEETIEKFMMGNPLLSEVESQILLVKDLEMKVSSEPEYICVGAIALYTGKVQLSTSF